MAEVTDTLDRSLLYERVREELRERCLRAESSMLPPLRRLSEELSVNHFTISRALRDLESDGLVKILPRRGIFIQPPVKHAEAANTVELVTFNSGLRNISLHLLRGIEEVAGGGQAHNVMLTHSPLPDSQEFIQTLQKRGVGAVLFNGVSYLPYPDSLHEANFIYEVSQHLPIAIVGGPHNIVQADCVYGDTRPAMREYLELCHQKGLERFAYLGADSHRPANNERFACFRNFILEHRLEWNERWMVKSRRESADHRAAVQQIFKGQRMPQVVIAYNANYAYATLLEMQRGGLHPGKDVHLLAFTSLESDALSLMPDATVISIDEVEVGRCAYKLVYEKMTGQTSNKDPRTLHIAATFMNNLLLEPERKAESKSTFGG